MAAPDVRRAFVVLHLALGLGILVATLQTLLHVTQEHGGPNLHVVFLVAAETIGAVLFLLPQTLRIGAVVLLILLLGGSVVHLTRGELEVHLLVYAAGVWFVMVHGAAWEARPRTSGVAV